MSIESELDQKVFIYAADGKLEKFEKYFAHNEIICKRIDEYTFSIRKLLRLYGKWHTRISQKLVVYGASRWGINRRRLSWVILVMGSHLDMVVYFGGVHFCTLGIFENPATLKQNSTWTHFG